jgi:hypothetical protein
MNRISHDTEPAPVRPPHGLTRAQLHAALDLLAEVRRMLGASVLHVDAFDVGPDVISTMIVDKACTYVRQTAESLHLELKCPGVEMDVFSGGGG